MDWEMTDGMSIEDAITHGRHLLADLDEAGRSAQNNAFDCWLRGYLSYEIPEIFPPAENNSFDEDKMNSRVFDVITKLICGDLAANLDELARRFCSQQSSSQRICGRVFRNGEVTYTCRTCATDATCVLCYECFSNSSHKDHKYRTSASGGSGYCDCGDVEAWKSDPFCGRHQAADPSHLTDYAQPPDRLIADGRVVLRSLLTYALQLLCWEYSDILPRDLSLRIVDEDHPYQTMLFNDESHSFDDVIMSLTRSLNCSEDRATFLASLVDREGRTTVATGQLDYCDRARLEIKHLSTIAGTKAPLIVETMSCCLVAHQQFAQRLLAWLTGRVQKLDCLLRLTTDVFMREKLENEGDSSMMLSVLRRDSRLWKSARVCIHQFIMGTVLLNADTKKQFALIFMQNYPSLMMDYVEDDHEHSLSIVALTVQIFTVPTIARLLIGAGNALETILTCVVREAEAYARGPRRRLCFQSTALHISFKRALLCLSDIRYLLTVPPEKSDDWTPDLRKQFLSGFDVLLKLLGLMQYMNEVTRRQGDHQEFESEWEMGFMIQLRLGPAITLIQRWAASDAAVCKACFDKVYEKCVEFRDATDEEDSSTRVEAFDKQVDVVKFNVSKEPVSIHIPLHRLLAGLHLILTQHHAHLIASIAIDWPRFFEYPLRIYVLSAQVMSGLWRRNGLAVPSQLHNYGAPFCRAEMFDKDLLLMQEGAATTDADEFIIRLLHRFNLLHWISTFSTSAAFHDESNRVMAPIFDQFLQLLICIVAERFCVGVGEDVEQSDCLRYLIVQLLCEGPKPFSKLEKFLPAFHLDEQTPSLDQIVRSVADFKPPTAGSAGVFSLKPQCWPEYAAFFYLRSKYDSTKAEEYQLKLRKDHADLAIRACPPPTPPRFSSFFKPVTNLLLSDVFLQICRQVLKRASDEDAFCAESHLHRLLYLLNLALNEQQREQKFDFARIAVAEQFDVLNELLRLKKSLSPTSRYFVLSDLLNYTIRRLAALSEDGRNLGTVERQESPDESKAEVEKKRRRELATKRREKAAQSIANMQNAFMKKHDIKMRPASESKIVADASNSAVAGLDGEAAQSASAGEELRTCFARPGRSYDRKSAGDELHCILCQSTDASNQSGLFVYAAFVQKSSLFSQSHMRVSNSKDEDDLLYPSADVFRGVFCNSCGHSMHYACWQKYVQFLQLKESRRQLTSRLNTFFDMDRAEYPCPLCKTLSNALLPVLTRSRPRGRSSHRGYEQWLEWVGARLNEVRQGREGGAWLRAKQPRPAEAEAEASVWETASVSGQALLADLTNSMRDQIQQVFNLGRAQNAEGDGNEIRSWPTESPDLECLVTFAKFIYTNGFGLGASDESAMMSVCCWQTVAFTLRSIDAILTFDRRPLFGAFSNREMCGLSSLVRSSALYTATCNVKSVQIRFARLLAPLADLTCIADPKAMPLCVLDLDIFCLLVQLTLASVESTATEHPGLLINDAQNLFKLCFSAYFLQAVCSVALKSAKRPHEHHSDHPPFAEFCSALCDKIGFGPGAFQHADSVNGLVQSLKHFLRLSALFFYFLQGVDPPEALCDLNIDEFVPLCRYLNLPISLNELTAFLDSLLIDRWISHPRFLNLVSSSNFTLQPTLANRLVELPERYCDLIVKGANFRCPSLVTDDSRSPTMCLACGCMLCSLAYCCQITVEGLQQIGACTNHARFCTCDKGIFLRVRDCQLMLTYQQTRGCYLAAPYVDEYGETDTGLKRGNPLHLDESMLRKLNTIWFHQTIPNTVASKLEMTAGATPFLNLIEWQHL